MGKDKKGAGKPEKKVAAIPEKCPYSGCKSSVKRFGFCAEHYDQFKFGLITKAGKPVSDYEKKLEQYASFKEKRMAQKVA